MKELNQLMKLGADVFQTEEKIYQALEQFEQLLAKLPLYFQRLEAANGRDSFHWNPHSNTIRPYGMSDSCPWRSIHISYALAAAQSIPKWVEHFTSQLACHAAPMHAALQPIPAAIKKIKKQVKP